MCFVKNSSHSQLRNQKWADLAARPARNVQTIKPIQREDFEARARSHYYSETVMISLFAAPFCALFRFLTCVSLSFTCSLYLVTEKFLSFLWLNLLIFCFFFRLEIKQKNCCFWRWISFHKYFQSGFWLDFFLRECICETPPLLAVYSIVVIRSKNWAAVTFVVFDIVKRRRQMILVPSTVMILGKISQIHKKCFTVTHICQCHQGKNRRFM